MNFPIKGEGRNRRTGGACACVLRAAYLLSVNGFSSCSDATLRGRWSKETTLSCEKEGKHVSKTDESCMKRV